jgi:superfamily II DNA or RNA helicase
MQVVRRDPDKGYLDSLFWIPKSQVNVDGAKAALSFQFFEDRTTRHLFLWKETPSHLLVPREFWDPKDCDFPTVDCRPRSYTPTNVTSRITLDFKDPSKTTQRDALAALLDARGGILQLGCGKGKTVIFLELIARMRVPTLIVVDNTQLMQQWQDAIAQFLDVPDGVGLIQADVFDWKHSVVLATYTTLANHADTMDEEIRRWFGLIGWDEGHHMAAPTWARGADLFYGKRILLTATPERSDGYNVIYDFHVGRVIFKDLTQDLKPDFYFLWTGMKLRVEDPIVRTQVHDKNGELHIGKIASYFATWRERLEKVLTEVRAAVSEGRRIIVLSKSVDELINLLALWNGVEDLYTDIPWPSPEEVGEKLSPEELTTKEMKKLGKALAVARDKLKGVGVNPARRELLRNQCESIEIRLKQHEVFRKVRALRDKRQRDYLKALLAMPGNAGLMIRKVSPKERTIMLRSKQVMFAIAKYGREGLDEERLDTIIASMPVSDRNALQQLMGRIQRKKAGKKRVVCVFLEDDIGLLIAMCRNIRRHLRDWPAEDGGPYSYTNIGHPLKAATGGVQWAKQALRAPGL